MVIGEINWKNALRSKTVWAGIIIALVGVAKALGYDVPVELIVPLASALGIVGIRQAIGNK